VIQRPYCGSRAAFDALLEQNSVKVARRHVAASDADARTLAARGYGLGILPGGAEDGAIALDPAFLRTVRAYGVASRQRSAAAATLLQLLRAAGWSARRPAA